MHTDAYASGNAALAHSLSYRREVCRVDNSRVFEDAQFPVCFQAAEVPQAGLPATRNDMGAGKPADRGKKGGGGSGGRMEKEGGAEGGGRSIEEGRTQGGLREEGYEFRFVITTKDYNLKSVSFQCLVKAGLKRGSIVDP